MVVSFMDALLINHTNHLSDSWPLAEQQAAAAAYGRVVDLPAPVIAADCSEDQIEALAEAYVERILEWQPAAVLCQGEYCYTYAVVHRLRDAGITVLAACSERMVEERQEADGSVRRVSRFCFTRFRRYI